MKNRFYIPAFAATSFIVMGLIVSCSNSTTTSATSSDTTITDKIKDATASAGGAIQNAADTAVKDVEEIFKGKNPDSVFVVKATLSNKKEIEMLHAGIDKGASKSLKSAAKMMLADHMKLGESVKKYATKFNYMLPGDDQGKASEALNKISDKSGGDWDKAWTDDMIDDHKDAVSTFEKYQDKVKDPDLKAMITNTLPTLHSHLDMVQKLKDNLK